MLYQYTAYFWVLIATAFLSGLLGCLVWFRRDHPASQPFAWMVLCIVGYATVAALEAAATRLSDKIFWSKLEYVGSGSVIVFFLIFALYFTRHQEWLTPRRKRLLWLLPIFNVLLVATNEWHFLIWKDFRSSAIGPNQITYIHGLGFYWVMACVYLYVGAASILLLKQIIRPSPLQRRQSLMVLLGTLIPSLGSGLYMFGITPPGLNVTPMSFLLTGVIYSTSILRFRMFDLVPVARDVLIERMGDGVLVLDAKKRLIDMNPSARSLLNIPVDSVGQPVERVLLNWPELSKICCQEPPVMATVFLDMIPSCYIEVQFSVLYDRWRRYSGRLVLLRDVTQRHQVELELRRMNQQLLDQLHEIKVLKDQLQEQAIRDSLTGLFNRRYLETALPKELARAERKDYPVAILLLDIDYFKQINDTYGHQAGDRMLQVFGDLLNHQTRLGDIACRYGGEEFALALSGLDLEQALVLAERIRMSFQSMIVNYQNRMICATVSAGVALFPKHGKTPDALLNRADKALYAAKAAGRNCIRVAR